MITDYTIKRRDWIEEYFGQALSFLAIYHPDLENLTFEIYLARPWTYVVRRNDEIIWERIEWPKYSKSTARI